MEKFYEDKVKEFLRDVGRCPDIFTCPLKANGLGVRGQDWWIKIIKGSVSFFTLDAQIEIVRILPRGKPRIELSVTWNSFGYFIKYGDKVIAQKLRDADWILCDFDRLYKRIEDWDDGYQKGYFAGLCNRK